VGYVSLNAPADPAIGAIADEVWELAEQPDPDSSAKPFADGMLEIFRTIDPEYKTAKISSGGSGFTLGNPVSLVKKAIVLTGGAGQKSAISKKDAVTGETVYLSGTYAVAAPAAAGKYEAIDAQVIFAAERRALKWWVIPVMAVIILVLIWLPFSFLIKNFGPVFKVKINTGDTDKPVSIAKKRLGNLILGSGCSLKDVAVKIVSINRVSNIDTSGFDVLRENIISFNDGKWEIKKSNAFSAIPDMATEFMGKDEIFKTVTIKEKIGGTGTEIRRPYTLVFYDYKGDKR
jgi:hypothetical protein